MSHFYGGIRGQAGQATRTGSRNSGYSAYAQTWIGRISMSLQHSEHEARDMAGIRIEGGPSTSGRGHSFPTFDVNLVAKAIESSDPKFDKILSRIDAEFRKLDAEAPKAIKRSKRRRKLNAQRQEKAYAAKLETERQFATTITDAEAHHFFALLDLDADEYDLSTSKDLERIKLRIASSGWAPEHAPIRDENGDLIVNNGYGSFNMRRYNLTIGIDLENEEAA